ncbi:MAG: hypothetical protein IPP69_13970 [Flavobacteriales bacterium]|nr:hypothetical protein [Flavobacteriales bacterium]
MIISLNKNPIVNGRLNPFINGRISPLINGNINPLINGNINPLINGNINPLINGNINPLINGNINPLLNGNINPRINGNINPLINGNKNPNINYNYQGLFIFDRNLMLQEFVINVNDRIIQIFDSKMRNTRFGVKHNMSGYCIFNLSNQYIGHFESDSEQGYNEFSTSNSWTNIIK